MGTWRWIVKGGSVMVYLRCVISCLHVRRRCMRRLSTELLQFVQVHRICFALSLLHFILGALLIGVKDTKDKRASIQNGYVLSSVSSI